MCVRHVRTCVHVCARVKTCVEELRVGRGGTQYHWASTKTAADAGLYTRCTRYYPRVTFRPNVKPNKVPLCKVAPNLVTTLCRKSNHNL